MNPVALLSLIGSLYEQLAAAEDRAQRAEQALAQIGAERQ